jgi:hypothetical protein
MAAGKNFVVTVGTAAATSSKALSARRRRELIVANTHATQVLYVDDVTGVTTGTGHPVGPGASVPFGDYDGDVYVIGSGAGTTYRITEVY